MELKKYTASTLKINDGEFMNIVDVSPLAYHEVMITCEGVGGSIHKRIYAVCENVGEVLSADYLLCLIQHEKGINVSKY